MISPASDALVADHLVAGDVRVSRHPRDRDTELTRCVLGPGQRHVEMREQPMGIAVVSGHGILRCRGAVRPLRGGDIHVCRPGTVCAVVAGPGDLSLETLTARPRTESLALSRPTPEDVHAAMDETIAAWDAGDEERRDRGLDRFRVLLGDPRADWNALPESIEPGAVRRARLHLEDHPSSSVSLDQLAEVSGLSKFHLARSFRAYYGLPPHHYWIHHRVARARTRLAAGEPAPSVAAHLGFVDGSHFGRRFRQIVGIPPAAYARASITPARGHLR